MDKTFNKSKRKGYDGIGYEKRGNKLKLNINLVLFVRNIDEPVQQQINSFLFEQMFGMGAFFYMKRICIYKGLIGTCQTSMMEIFGKIVIVYRLLTIFIKALDYRCLIGSKIFL